MDQLRYVFDAVASIRRALDRPRAADRLLRQPVDAGLLHGRRRAARDDYRLVKTMLYARPDLMHRILAINADAVAAYLNAQIDAGAQAVMIFDSWGGVLADGAFQRFSLAYTQRVLRQLKRERDGRRVPQHRLHQGRRPVARGDRRAAAPTSSASTGRSTSARRARASATASRCRATSTRTCCSRRPTRSAREVARVLDSFGRGTGAAASGHVFNLGHGISQHTPPEHVAALVDAVHAPVARATTRGLRRVTDVTTARLSSARMHAGE